MKGSCYRVELKKLLGLSTKKRLPDKPDLEKILKAHLIQARRLGNMERAILLSQAREYVKKMSKSACYGYCVDCGVVIMAKSTRCMYHAKIAYRYPKQIKVG